MSKNLKLLLLDVEDFKGIHKRVIHFDSKSAYLIGGNATDKSSVMDAILSPLDSSFVPSMPINKDSQEHRGTIRLQIGNEDVLYEINATYTPSNRTGTLELYENGVQVTKAVKTKVKEIFGTVSFDIFEFISMNMHDKIEVVKKQSGCADKLNILDEEYKDLEDERKHLNKSIAEMQVVNSKDNRPFEPEEIRKYEKEEPVDAINAELEAMKPAIEKWKRMNDGCRDLAKDIARWQTEDIPRLKHEEEQALIKIEEMERHLEELRSLHRSKGAEVLAFKDKIAIEQQRVDKASEWLKNNEEPDTTAITKRLAESAEHNRMHQIIKVYRERQQQLIKKQGEQEATQKKMDAITDKRVKLIAGSQLPVKGLSWDSNMLYLDGVPFEKNQVNTAKQMEVGIKMAVAMNPNLRLIMIRDASLFDKPNLTRIVKDLNDHGYQWICELVAEDGDDMVVKFYEEELA